MKKFTTYLASILMLVLLSVSVFGQVNTPAGATWPFGSRIQQFPTAPYPFGLIPATLPTGTYNPASNLYGKSQDAYDEYVIWRNCYAYNCGGTQGVAGAGGEQWRIKFDDGSQTVSEGIAYGMLLSAYAADKRLFDGLWNYYKQHANARGYMNWEIGSAGGTVASCNTTVVGSNGAADSDFDATMALIIASCQWPNTVPAFTTPFNYLTEAQTMISKLRTGATGEISTCASGINQISNGDAWVIGCPANHDCRNPSYQCPAYVKHFQAYDAAPPSGTYWTATVYNTIYGQLLNNNRNATTGLVSNWCSVAGVMNTCAAPAFSDHGYDAVRNPWRMATDYIWWGDANALAICNLLSNWIYTKTTNLTAAGNLRGPVDLNGANNGRTLAGQDAIFTSMWGAATIGADATGNHQATTNYMYGRVKGVINAPNCNATSNTGYYGNTLRMISLFMMTGNFWKPCPPRCQTPAFPADSVSLCGSASVTLTQSLAAGTGRTFQWYTGTNTSSPIGGATSPTYAASAAGWYTLKVDTTGGCSTTASVYVKSTAVYPKLGANIKLCYGTSATLNSRVQGTGYTYTWDYSSTGFAGLTAIPGETNYNLTNVRKPGLYRVTVSKASCATLFDTITVTSTQISPGDNCVTTAPAAVTLSVVGPNLGAASLYDWYNVPTGGSVLSGGTGTYSYNTGSLAAGTYTYYVKDKSKQYAKIGKVAPTNPIPVSCAALNIPGDLVSVGFSSNPVNQYFQSWTINKTIDIDSVTLYFCLYNDTDLPLITFALTNVTTGTTVTTAPRPGIRIVNPLPNDYSMGATYPGLIKGVRYYVGHTGVTAGQYQTKITVATYLVVHAANLVAEQGPTVSYGYRDDLDGNTAVITNTFSPSGNTIYANRYGHGYDWTISTANTCDRIPVFAYIGTCPAGLPVDLADFSGKSFASSNKLSWTTLSEKDADYFVVERAYEGQDFVEIGKVKAKGNSSSITEYTFNDYGVSEMNAYYRLAQYDTDGKKHYSYSIFISRSGSEKVTVFPNPANTQVTIKAVDADSEFTLVTILDLMGKEVLSSSGAALEKQLDISELPNGIYFVNVKFHGSSEIVRLVKN